MKILNIWLASAVGVALTGTGQAAPVFQGRLADGTASSTCTVSGATKCTSFFDSDLDITILNNWNIGAGFWSATAAVGSAQAMAESAGFAATGLAGWVLPTGDGKSVGGPLNQFKSWEDRVGFLGHQFDGVQPTSSYWSGTEFASDPGFAWHYMPLAPAALLRDKGFALYAVAVRPGDVSAAVPEPQTLALSLLAWAATVVARRGRPA